VLSASGSNDVLIGGSGVSTLVAYGSNDTLIGGSGTTTFVGNAAGNTLQAGSGTSTLLYGANGLTVNLSAGTAKLNGASIGDTLVGLSSIIYSGSNGTLIGSNGANVLAATGAGDTLIAGSGANTLVGYGANEVLIGGSGTNTLVAAGVSDTLVAGSGGGVLRNFGALGAYDFNAGSGSAIIINGQSSGSSASNELDFGTGISDSQLWFVQSGSDLQIDLMGTSKQVTVKGWFSSAGSQLQEITAGGLKLDNQVSQLVQAMATYSAGHTGFDPSIVTQMPNDPTLQGAVAAAWHS
jgi:Ca2+-binding RTX toxin-like protein